MSAPHAEAGATHDQARMLQVAGTLLNMEIELEDEAYTTKDPQGNDTRIKFLPQNLVVLTYCND